MLPVWADRKKEHSFLRQKTATRVPPHARLRHMPAPFTLSIDKQLGNPVATQLPSFVAEPGRFSCWILIDSAAVQQEPKISLGNWEWFSHPKTLRLATVYWEPWLFKIPGPWSHSSHEVYLTLAAGSGVQTTARKLEPAGPESQWPVCTCGFPLSQRSI